MFGALKNLLTRQADLGPPSAVTAEEAATSSRQDLAAQHGDTVEMHLHFLHREPVLNQQEQLVGYALSLQKTRQDTGLVQDRELVGNILALGADRLLRDKLAFIEVSPAMLSDEGLQALPAQNVVLVLQPGNAQAQDLAEGQARKAQGFRLAIDNPEPHHPDREAWLRLADYIRFDMSQIDTIEELGTAVVSALEVAIRPLIAFGVDSEEQFAACQKLAFNYFEGYYATHPPLTASPRLSSQRLKVLEVLNLVKNNADVRDIEASLKSDPTITYKILRYINSPANGLAREVQSIGHAVTILGHDRLYRWLTLLMFASEQADSRSQVLLSNALVRASLMERLAETRTAEYRGGLFLTGILSMLEALLRIPLRTALSDFYLPPAVAQALLKQDGPYAPYLALAIACETGGPHQLAAALLCGSDVARVNQAHMDAMVWAEAVNK